jgi:uncharacterized membrane protein
MLAQTCAQAGGSASQSPNYRVTLLGSLGGANSGGASIDDWSLVAGYSTLADGSRHASAWYGNQPWDLGTLGTASGLNSTVIWPVKNHLGVVSGISLTDAVDPLNEGWSCAAFLANPGGRICQGFVWVWGAMHALPSLGTGAHNSFATGTNDLGITVGWAENDVADASCVAPQVLQFKPVLWGGGGLPSALPLLGQDTSGAATAINNRGQVVGISGICDQAVGRYSAAHAVLWENGRATELVNPNGAPYWNTPNMINERGDVVGFAGFPGDIDGNLTPPFLWTRQGGFQILPMRQGDIGGSAQSINDRGEIVGYAYPASFQAHPLYWQSGSAAPVDLNTLIEPVAGYVLSIANDINDRGEITGYATATDGSGTGVAFVATPIGH